MPPRGTQERVYRLQGLVAEVWLLIRHCLVLLILHSLGYQGSYRDLRTTRGWAGEVSNVRWKSGKPYQGTPTRAEGRQIPACLRQLVGAALHTGRTHAASAASAMPCFRPSSGPLLRVNVVMDGELLGRAS